MCIKIQGPKEVQRIRQKGNWKIESARKADSAFLILGLKLGFRFWKTNFVSKKSRVGFPGNGAKADSAFSSDVTVESLHFL